MTRLRRQLLLWGVLLLFQGPLCGATLHQLITENGELVSGDKRFANFAYDPTGDSPVSAMGIDVRPIEQDGLFGIEFIGSFFDLPGNGSTSSLISYDVSVTNPKFEILGASLSGNPSVVVGSGSVVVTDTFVDGPTETLEIHHRVPEQELLLLDWKMFPAGVASLKVEKRITLEADEQPGAATISFVRQTYKQALVPEPSTLSLCSLTIFGLVRRGRRSRRKPVGRAVMPRGRAR